jgi:hypothetical protein
MGGAIYRGKTPSGAWIHIYPNLAWIRIYPDFPFLICLLRKSPTELVSIDCEHEGRRSGRTRVWRSVKMTQTRAARRGDGNAAAGTARPGR